MKPTLGFTKNLFLLITTLATGCIATTSSSQAATLSTADASIEIFNFSQSPESGFASVNSITNSYQINSDTASVTSIDNTDASFLIDSPLGLINSSIEVFGKERGYLGTVKNESKILGNFFVDANKNSQKSFSFNLLASLNLETSIENSLIEDAATAANTLFVLVDSSDNNNYNILDFFSLSGNLTTTGTDELFSYKKSENFTLDSFTSYADSGVELQAEFANADALVSYNREFNSPTHLSLIGIKKTEVTVKAPAVGVPEPSSSLALFLLGSFIFTGLRILKSDKHS